MYERNPALIPKDRKRLAEVDFPIAEVSRHAVREKSIRYGHPSTLHLWWTQRPLASSRAALTASLLPDPDPCDVHFHQATGLNSCIICTTVAPLQARGYCPLRREEDSHGG